MSVKRSRVIWFGNDYGIEFHITDPYTINFNIIKGKDVTLIDTNDILIGSDACHRSGEISEETGEVIQETIESLQDFAARSYKEGLSFAEEMISEHKEAEELSAIFTEVCKTDLEAVKAKV